MSVAPHYGVVRLQGGRRRLMVRKNRAVDVPDLPEPGTWVEAEQADGSWSVRTIAAAGSGLAKLHDLVRRAGMVPTHSQKVLKEAAAWVRSPGIDDPTLADFTHLPLVPIDEVTSKDLDQAVAIELSSVQGARYVVWYALADAAYYVRPGSALYDAALERGATYYLPGLVVPMLPRSLSEGIISLNAGEDRRAMLFELHLDQAGRCVERRIHRARVHCRHKLDFEGVQAFLDGVNVSWDADVQQSLRLLKTVGMLRMSLADERNVVRYRRTEVDVELEGLRFVAIDGPRNDVERYNEQISLLTNVQGARFLRAAAAADFVQPIYRVHEPPPPDRVTHFAALTKHLAGAHAHPEWAWSLDGTGIAAYLEQLPEGPVGKAIHRQAMIINRPSVFSVEAGLHHGVGADVYGRFTAPMREIVGIFLHNEVWEALRGAPYPVPQGYDGEALRERIVVVANEAKSMQRRFNHDTNRFVLDDLFSSDRAPRLGVVMGITSSRVHVRLDAPPIDVKAYVAHLNEAWQTELTVKDEIGLVDSSGEMRLVLGDRVTVTVIGHDPRRDRWNLILEELE